MVKNLPSNAKDHWVQSLVGEHGCHVLRAAKPVYHN